MKAHGVSSLKGILLAAVILAAGSALAASKGSLDLQHPTNVGGKQLASGTYTVRWDGTGDQVDLKIYQGKKEVASTPARVTKIERPSPSNSAVITSNGDNTFSLVEIRFSGKDFALQIANAAGGAGAAGASASQ